MQTRDIMGLFGATALAGLVGASPLACSAVIGLGDVPEPVDASVAPVDGARDDAVGTTSPDAAPHDASAKNDGSPASMDAATDAASDGAAASDASFPEASPDGPTGDGGHTPVSLDGCVLLLHMDEASWSGAGSVHDASGSGNDGSPIGDATPTSTGKFGGAGLFSGAGYVDILDSASLHPTTALTYAAWIYPTGFSSGSLYPGIISKRQDYAADVAFTMFLWSNNNLWGDLEGYRFNSVATFTNGQWYHVAMVFDGTVPDATARVSIYVNGVLDSLQSAGTSLGSHSSDLDIGYLQQGTRNDSAAYFIGRIDEVVIWNRALGASEIQSLASATGPL